MRIKADIELEVEFLDKQNQLVELTPEQEREMFDRVKQKMGRNLWDLHLNENLDSEGLYLEVDEIEVYGQIKGEIITLNTTAHCDFDVYIDKSDQDFEDDSDESEYEWEVFYNGYKDVLLNEYRMMRGFANDCEVDGIRINTTGDSIDFELMYS